MPVDAGIDHPSQALRLLVWQALKTYTTAHLEQFLNDRSSIVRSAAARELQVRGEKESLSMALRLAADSRARCRETACFLLGQLGTPHFPYKLQSLPTLKKALLHDRSSAVRAAAAAALGHLSAAEELDALVLAATDKSENVRRAVAFALSRMKRFRRAREALEALRADKAVSVR